LQEKDNRPSDGDKPDKRPSYVYLLEQRYKQVKRWLVVFLKVDTQSMAKTPQARKLKCFEYVLGFWLL
jgi:hypothetical protein